MSQYAIALWGLKNCLVVNMLWHSRKSNKSVSLLALIIAAIPIIPDPHMRPYNFNGEEEVRGNGKALGG